MYGPLHLATGSDICVLVHVQLFSTSSQKPWHGPCRKISSSRLALAPRHRPLLPRPPPPYPAGRRYVAGGALAVMRAVPSAACSLRAGATLDCGHRYMYFAVWLEQLGMWCTGCGLAHGCGEPRSAACSLTLLRLPCLAPALVRRSMVCGALRAVTSTLTV